MPAFAENGFTRFGVYKKIGGDNIEPQPIVPVAGATGQIDVTSTGDTANIPANFAGAGWVIFEGEVEGEEWAMPVFRVNRV